MQLAWKRCTIDGLRQVADGMDAGHWDKPRHPAPSRPCPASEWSKGLRGTALKDPTAARNRNGEPYAMEVAPTAQAGHSYACCESVARFSAACWARIGSGTSN
jgi:hypothetical protein